MSETNKIAKAFYTARDMARICGVDLKTIHNWVERGRIQHFRTPGRHLRFHPSDVAKFLRTWGFTFPPELEDVGANAAKEAVGIAKTADDTAASDRSTDAIPIPGRVAFKSSRLLRGTDLRGAIVDEYDGLDPSAKARWASFGFEISINSGWIPEERGAKRLAEILGCPSRLPDIVVAARALVDELQSARADLAKLTASLGEGNDG